MGFSTYAGKLSVIYTEVGGTILLTGQYYIRVLALMDSCMTPILSISFICSRNSSTEADGIFRNGSLKGCSSVR